MYTRSNIFATQRFCPSEAFNSFNHFKLHCWSIKKGPNSKHFFIKKTMFSPINRPSTVTDLSTLIVCRTSALLKCKWIYCTLTMTPFWSFVWYWFEHELVLRKTSNDVEEKNTFNFFMQLLSSFIASSNQVTVHMCKYPLHDLPLNHL